MNWVRTSLIIIFSLLLLGAIAAIAIYGKDLFQSNADVYYKNGCHEHYVNRQLTTPECPKDDGPLFSMPTQTISYNVSYR